MAVRREPGRSLTAREREVAALVAGGLASKQNAARLLVSVRTVDVHLSAAFATTQTGTRTRLAAWWLRQDAR
jgi:DNA-binding CsgD family transcriptional regulator